jgi:hypothetical protein
MDIFSCFGMWNSGPKFVRTFQLHPAYTWWQLLLKTAPEDGAHVPKHVLYNNSACWKALCRQEYLYNKYYLWQFTQLAATNYEMLTVLPVSNLCSLKARWRMLYSRHRYSCVPRVILITTVALSAFKYGQCFAIRQNNRTKYKTGLVSEKE